jgi:hypothetical protein
MYCMLVLVSHRRDVLVYHSNQIEQALIRADLPTIDRKFSRGVNGVSVDPTSFELLRLLVDC